MSQKSKSLWGHLRQRLIAVLREPGAKTKLAHTMGVSRPAVSQWIAEDGTAPTAEMTLQLLAWVQAEEVKPKSPGRAETRPEPKTQPWKSSYEKPKSGRKKR
jgi:hypothetical protein